jgi:hypothetical protein
MHRNWAKTRELKKKSSETVASIQREEQFRRSTLPENTALRLTLDAHDLICRAESILEEEALRDLRS